MKKKFKNGISYMLTLLFVLSSTCLPQTALAKTGTVLKNNVEIQLSENDQMLHQMVQNQFEEIRQNKLQKPESPVSGNVENEIETAIDYIEEVESNDDFSTADRMYVGDAAKGYIDSENDIDIYKIKYTDYGVAKIKLSSIPSGCDYDLLIYDSNYDTVIACIKGGDESECAYFYPEPREWYYAVVGSADDFDDSDSYILRFSLLDYTAKLYGGDQGDIDTTVDLNNASLYFGEFLEYEIKEYNPPTESNLISMPGASIILLSGHGNPDHVRFRDPDPNASGDSDYYCGVYSGSSYESGTSKNYKYVGLRDVTLSACNLLIFAACQSAGTSDEYSKNIAQRAISVAEAKTSIGWEPNVNNSGISMWLPMFFYYLQNNTVKDAARQVNLKFAGEDWPDDVYEWVVYGDPDTCIKLPYSPTAATIEDYALSENPTEVKAIDTNISINVSTKNFDALESYLEENVTGFSTNTFVLDENRIHDSGEGDYFLYYNYMKDGFSTPYYVVVSCENGKPKLYSFNFTTEPEIPVALSADSDNIEMSNIIIDTAKAAAIQEIPNQEATVTAQEVTPKMDKEGNKFLRVSTTVTETIGDDEFDTLFVYDFTLN